MALDGAFLYAVRQELSGLIGSRIEKIHQPAREEILISLRNMEGSHKILISASADRARVHLTQQSIDNTCSANVLHVVAETAGKWKTPCDSARWIGTCAIF